MVEPGSDEGQVEALLARHRLELDPELAHQLVDAEARRLRPHRPNRAAICRGARRGSPRRRRGRRRHCRRGRRLAAVAALDNGRGVEPRGVQRLQDVVARRREEARLREVRLVGVGLRGGERRVEALELLGALADALLQALIGARQRLGRLDAVGDVGIGRHDAAVGHRVRPDLQHDREG